LNATLVTRLPFPLQLGSAPFTIRGDWAAEGAQHITGHYSLKEFGKLAVRELSAGRPLVVNDNVAEMDPEEAATFQQIGISATVCVPLLRDGRLTALMAVHHCVRHQWTDHEVALVLEVTDSEPAASRRGTNCPAQFAPGLPRVPAFDETLSRFREGCGSMPLCFADLGFPIFRTRLMLRDVICLTGPEAARVFYEDQRLTRVSAMLSGKLHKIGCKVGRPRPDPAQISHSWSCPAQPLP
jgi:hypothetical protein